MIFFKLFQVPQQEGRLRLFWCAGLAVACLFVLTLGAPAARAATDDFAQARRQMIAEIEEDARETAFYLKKRALDQRVLDAMGRVERHRFVPPEAVPYGYRNQPLPIGYGQTISQPYIVALMTDLLEVKEGLRVLEIGTGSGYQAAVLAQLGVRVWSMEIIPPLAEQARRRLADLGYDRVEVRVGDGYYGWPEQAPFDAIVVTAAAGHVPPPLIRQLAAGGRLVIPVGSAFAVQQLTVVEKDEAGRISARQLLPVRFVPLTGGPP